MRDHNFNLYQHHSRYEIPFDVYSLHYLSKANNHLCDEAKKQTNKKHTHIGSDKVIRCEHRFFFLPLLSVSSLLQKKKKAQFDSIKVQIA